MLRPFIKAKASGHTIVLQERDILYSSNKRQLFLTIFSQTKVRRKKIDE